MPDLPDDALSLIGLTIGLLGVLSDLYARHVDKLRAKQNPTPAETARLRSRREELNRSLFLYGLPLCVLQVSFVYLLLPTAVNVATNAKIALWAFELDRALFLLFFCLGLVVAGIGITYFVKNARKRSSLPEAIQSSTTWHST